MGAINYFTKSYVADPKGYYGELSFLYLGKTYALYSYSVGSRKGILSAVAFLNQYPNYYKVPRFVNVQREFIGDSYTLMGWYEDAVNVFANLYGETEEVRYLIKLGYASALGGSAEGYTYLKKMIPQSVPKDYRDIYFLARGYYEFNFGRYREAIEFLSEAANLNEYVRKESHYLYRLGISYYKLGRWQKATLFLELTLRYDKFKDYNRKTNFYLTFLNLRTKNYKEALRSVKTLTGENQLFYSKLSQILYSSLWLYPDFLKTYQEEFKFYRDMLRQIAWLNVGNVYGDIPLLGIYSLALDTLSLSEDEKELIRTKNLKLTEFILEGDLFDFNAFLEYLNGQIDKYDVYDLQRSKFLNILYLLNKNNVKKAFGKGIKKFAEASLFLGDKNFWEQVNMMRDGVEKSFLVAKMMIVEGRESEAVGILRKVSDSLEKEDRLEAELLIAYYSGDMSKLEKLVGAVDVNSPRFRGYITPSYMKLADYHFGQGNYERALDYYTKYMKDVSEEMESYWWALYRVGKIAEYLGDEERIKWVVNKASGKDNIWSRVILTLWGA